ncbi:hypothetical protein T484DRAFT_3641512 [Baffinella frigidus]|nr:hypothetical protein T484DRAFT_3641512 [Cryptophyta sp. CCMP2293]
MEYPEIDKVIGITTIPEATYRFIHGEISDWREYKKIMDGIMDHQMGLLDAEYRQIMDGITNHHVDSLDASRDLFYEKTRAYTKVANKRLYGKTPLEMFVSLEIAVDLAHADVPNVAFRNHLRRTFLGLLALQQAVGPWVDVSDGASRGQHRQLVTPIKDFVAKRPTQPLTDSLLFDYIQLLFPETSAIPLVDVTRMRHKVVDMQKRINAIEEKLHPKMYQYGTFGTWFGSISDTAGLHQNKKHVNVEECMSTIIHSGTRENVLFYTKRREVDAVDAIMIPFVTMCMNHAQEVSGFWDQP